LLSKPERAEEARRLFKGTDVDVLINGCKDSGVELNCEGTRHLGAAVGTEDFKTRFVKTKVTNWVQAVEKLAVVAQSQPHAAFASFTHCLQSQWTFLARSMPRTSPLFQPLEDAIRKVLIPALLRRDVTDLERDILGLPARFGGLGLYKPTEECQLAHDNSLLISLPLVRLISRQEAELDPKAIMDETKAIRRQIDAESEKRHKARSAELYEAAPAETKLCLKVANEKGASSWITAAPSFDHETILHKGEFTDAVYMRYGWAIPDLPLVCACGESFSVQHALDCLLGGYRTIQHNEVRDVFAHAMREAGHTAVEVEPALQPLTGEVFDFKSANKEPDARSDIKVRGFWRNMQQAFFDVKVVSPYARSYSRLTAAQLYRMAEKSKMREYAERIREVEHGTFNALVFTTAGGAAPQSSAILKRLAEQISEKKNLHRSVVSGWLRCRLSFALLRTSLLCLRGTRRKRHFNHSDNDIELAVSEAKMAY